MTIATLLTHCSFGLLSFLIIYILRKRYKINRLYNTIFSITLLLFYATIINYLNLKSINKNIFIVFIFQFIFDFIYTTYFLEEDFFNKRDCNTGYYFLLIFIGLVVNNSFINKVDSIFLTPDELRIVIWGLIFIFLYKFFKKEKIFNQTYRTSKLLDEGNILTMFTRLRRKYLKDIKVTDMKLELAIYSIMIFHNSKRNSLIRTIDNILFKINGKERKLGIMQIPTNHFITDIESIEMVTQDLKKAIGKKSSAGSVESALSNYMKDDNLEVLEIYNTLKNFFKI